MLQGFEPAIVAYRIDFFGKPEQHELRLSRQQQQHWHMLTHDRVYVNPVLLQVAARHGLKLKQLTGYGW